MRVAPTELSTHGRASLGHAMNFCRATLVALNVTMFTQTSSVGTVTDFSVRLGAVLSKPEKRRGYTAKQCSSQLHGSDCSGYLVKLPSEGNPS